MLRANGYERRPILGEALARAAKYPYPEVLADQVLGSPIVGLLPRNTAFPGDAPEDVKTEEWLRSQACFAHSAAEAKARAQDMQQARDVYTKTKEELEKGLLRGPFSAEQLTDRHGNAWVGSPRFGILQKDVTRCIDDFSIF